MKGKGIWLVGLVIVLVVMSGPLFVSQTQSATGPQPLSPLPSTPVPKPTATASFTATPTVTPTTRITDSTTSPVEPRLHRWVSATDPITATATVSDTCKPPPACACSLIWPCRLTPPRDGEPGWCDCHVTLIITIRKNYTDPQGIFSTPTATPTSTPTPTSMSTATSTGTIPFYIPVIFKKYGQ